MLKNIKNSKRLFFIVGPSSTGNHLLALLFINAKYSGKKCFGKYSGPQLKGFQKLEEFACPELLGLKSPKKIKDIIGDFDGDIVYRKSIPASKMFNPPLLRIAKAFENENYQVIWVIPIRAFYYTIQSKKRIRRCKDIDDGWRNLQREYKYIFDVLIKHKGNFWLVPISIIFAHPEIIVKEMEVFYDLKVDINNLNQIFDADRTWRNRIITKK